MRYMLVVVALFTVACGDSSTAPERTFSANVALAGGPTIGQCAGDRCAYTVSVINNGPDCAARVSVSMLVPVPEPAGRFPSLAVGIAAPGVIRAGQVVALSGNDWPANGGTPSVSVTGAGAACP